MALVRGKRKVGIGHFKRRKDFCAHKLVVRLARPDFNQPPDDADAFPVSKLCAWFKQKWLRGGRRSILCQSPRPRGKVPRVQACRMREEMQDGERRCQRLGGHRKGIGRPWRRPGAPSDHSHAAELWQMGAHRVTEVKAPALVQDQRRHGSHGLRHAVYPENCVALPPYGV